MLNSRTKMWPSYYLLLCTCAMCFSGEAAPSCELKLEANSDVIFVMDVSAGVSQATFDDYKQFVRELILAKMLDDSRQHRLAIIRFSNGTDTAFDYVSNPSHISMSDYDTQVIRLPPPADNDTVPGIVEASKAARTIFKSRPDMTRTAVLVYVTDADFDDVTITSATNVTDAILEDVTAANGRLVVWGIGVGENYVEDNLLNLTQSENGSCEVMSILEWKKYLTTNYPSAGKREMVFSALLVTFALVNITILIMLILVCIYANKLKPDRPMKSSIDQKKASIKKLTQRGRGKGARPNAYVDTDLPRQTPTNRQTTVPDQSPADRGPLPRPPPQEMPKLLRDDTIPGHRTSNVNKNETPNFPSQAVTIAANARRQDIDRDRLPAPPPPPQPHDPIQRKISPFKRDQIASQRELQNLQTSADHSPRKKSADRIVTLDFVGNSTSDERPDDGISDLPQNDGISDVQQNDGGPEDLYDNQLAVTMAEFMKNVNPVKERPEESKDNADENYMIMSGNVDEDRGDYVNVAKLGDEHNGGDDPTDHVEDDSDVEGDYKNISSLRDEAVDSGRDYVNVNELSKENYFNIFKADFMAHLDKAKRWSQRVSSKLRDSAANYEVQNEPNTSGPGSLSQNVLQATVPPSGESQGHEEAGGNYVNKDVIQDFHDNYHNINE